MRSLAPFWPQLEWLNELAHTRQREREQLLPPGETNLKGRTSGADSYRRGSTDGGKEGMAGASSSGNPPKMRKKRRSRSRAARLSVPPGGWGRATTAAWRVPGWPLVPGHTHTAFERPSLRWVFSLFPHLDLLSCSWGPPATRSHCGDRAQRAQGLGGASPTLSGVLLTKGPGGSVSWVGCVGRNLTAQGLFSSCHPI